VIASRRQYREGRPHPHLGITQLPGHSRERPILRAARRSRHSLCPAGRGPARHIVRAFKPPLRPRPNGSRDAPRNGAAPTVPSRGRAPIRTASPAVATTESEPPKTAATSIAAPKSVTSSGQPPTADPRRDGAGAGFAPTRTVVGLRGRRDVCRSKNRRASLTSSRTTSPGAHLGQNAVQPQTRSSPGEVRADDSRAGGAPALRSSRRTCVLIRPAGKNAPSIHDPKPTPPLYGWKLRECDAVYAPPADPFFGQHPETRSIGQILLRSDTAHQPRAVRSASSRSRLRARDSSRSDRRRSSPSSIPLASGA